MSFRGVILPRLDTVRGILGRMGLRQYTVDVLVRTSTGRPGDQGSTPTTTTTRLYVAGGTQSPHVRQLTQKEIIASGGQYQDQDLEVGPLTPPFAGGGTLVGVFEPVMTPHTEVFFKLTGPGLPAGGAYYEKVGQSVDANLHYRFTLRKIGYVP